MGAGFCLFCASERSVIVSEVSNFVSWQGLIGTASAGHDEKKLNIPTVNFATAKYTSDYVEFVGRETAERNFEPLQELDERDYEILDAFNPERIIPFLLIDGRPVYASGLRLHSTTSRRHESCKGQRRGSKSCINVRQAIKTQADSITALICKSINGKAEVYAT